MISLHGVRFRYPNGVEALRGIDLQLESGCVCILGHNGAGKTTLFRHLNGLLKPNEGTVSVYGQETTGKRTAEMARFVALAFQNPDSQLFKESVVDEVRFGATNGRRESGTSDELVAWAMEIMELTDVAKKNPYDLLLGARKRVAVASVLAMDTPAVVLDEPTGGQDSRGVAIMSRLVGELLQRGKLVIVSSHDVEFAWKHADRLVVMDSGRIADQGVPSRVFRNVEMIGKAGVKAPAVIQVALAAGFPDEAQSADDLVGLFKARG